MQAVRSTFGTTFHFHNIRQHLGFATGLRFRKLLTSFAILWAASVASAQSKLTTYGPPLPGTERLTLDGDPAVVMIAGVDRFLLGALEASVAERAKHWKRDFSSPAAYEKSVELNREKLARIIGLRDGRIEFADFELVATVNESALVGEGDGFNVLAVRWPVMKGVHGSGLLLEPTGGPARAVVIVVPDCEQSPESLVGLEPGVPPHSQMARRLAESGCRVVVPLLMNRGTEFSSIADGRRRSNVNHRELLYRAAYQMGRHLIGYEVQKVLALVDVCMRLGGDEPPRIGTVGYGEGGLAALYAAAVDRRIAATGVSGYFNSRQQIWREPIDRNVFGILAEFGDAEIASLVSPRPLLVEACMAPRISIPAGGQGAPAESSTPALETVRQEFERARHLVAGLEPAPVLELFKSGNGAGPFGSDPFLSKLLEMLGGGNLRDSEKIPVRLHSRVESRSRLRSQFEELAEFSERLVEDGPRVRAEYFARVDRQHGIDAFAKSTAAYRSEFLERIIGDLKRPLVPAAPRSRLAYDDLDFRGYEVVIDVVPEVILYGILLVPRNLKDRERRPVVVCQHGLEGRAESTVAGDNTSYRDFASRLARRGFVTFSPQHLYRGGDLFRTLQRKANPLGMSLFSVMVAQHRQLLDWLGKLPFVDAQRIGFYGISYGGKSAMRIPAVLEGYALSICSSDFSDWIWRTVSNRFESGYLAHSEYEIFEFDLGTTFNYAEMAALICPRPFMVEEFHHSGLFAERSRGEFARVQLLYENLGISQRTRMTYYGPYQSNVPYADRETFEFLHEHLGWPRGAGAGD
jgi:dienelactone hydrolase